MFDGVTDEPTLDVTVGDTVNVMLGVPVCVEPCERDWLAVASWLPVTAWLEVDVTEPDCDGEAVRLGV